MVQLLPLTLEDCIEQGGWLRRLEHSPIKGTQAGYATVCLECSFYLQILPTPPYCVEKTNSLSATVILQSMQAEYHWRGDCFSSGPGDKISLGPFKVLDAIEYQLSKVSKDGHFLSYRLKY